MLQFVLLSHDWPTPHYDLMLESGGVLATWRLAALPTAGGEVRAEKIGDHRLAYLDYEGPVSDGRGRVLRVDRGECRTLSETDSVIVVELSGVVLRGRFVLADGPDGWRLHAG